MSGELAFVHDLGVVGPIYRMRVGGGEPKPVGQEGRIVWALSWSPDGRRIAYVSSGTTAARSISILAVRSGRSRVIRTDSGGPADDTWFQVAWAPDGKRLRWSAGAPASRTTRAST